MKNAMQNASRACKCYMAYVRRMHSAKRLFRIIESLGYKASEAEA
jgi:hypothetical protein